MFRNIRVRRSHSDLLIRFWKAKSKVYRGWINAPRTIEFESRWSTAIKEIFGAAPLVDTLLYGEDYIVDKVLLTFPHLRDSNIADSVKSIDQLRYKAPLDYDIERSYRSRVRLPEDTKLDKLDAIFMKERQHK
jgi:hypothetical protein